MYASRWPCLCGSPFILAYVTLQARKHCSFVKMTAQWKSAIKVSNGGKEKVKGLESDDSKSRNQRSMEGILRGIGTLKGFTTHLLNNQGSAMR